MVDLNLQIEVDGSFEKLADDVREMAEFIEGNPRHPFTEYAASVGELDISRDVLLETTHRDGVIAVTAEPIGPLRDVLKEFNSYRCGVSG